MDQIEKTIYNGSVERLKERNRIVYKIAYWSLNETYAHAVEYEIPMFENGADLVSGDLMLS